MLSHQIQYIHGESYPEGQRQLKALFRKFELLGKISDTHPQPEALESWIEDCAKIEGQTSDFICHCFAVRKGTFPQVLVGIFDLSPDAEFVAQSAGIGKPHGIRTHIHVSGFFEPAGIR